MLDFETVQSGKLSEFLDGSHILLFDYLPMQEDQEFLRDLLKNEWSTEINVPKLIELQKALTAFKDWFCLRYEDSLERVAYTSTFLEQLLVARVDALEERITLLARMGLPHEYLEELGNIQCQYGEVHDTSEKSRLVQHKLVTADSNPRLDSIWKFVNAVSNKKGYIKRKGDDPIKIGEELVTYAIYFATDRQTPVCIFTPDPKTIDVFCTSFKASYEEKRKGLDKYEKTPVILVDSRKGKPVIDAFSLRHSYYKDHRKLFE